MASAFVLLTLFMFTVVMSMSLPKATAVGDHRLRLVAMRARSCQGSIEECMEEGELVGMESSSSHRRILATSQYISYQALQRNTVPCSQRGASYYNCKPGAEANPYTRGCATITRCRNS
ncbi:rapid alkalinization factor-like [Arachis stenosperma]|uniref:rapid alkalinization factor-like n=1 Tax=Arachis stenosperma TaxID=217475 RepID=UPI0025AC1913|nr:rapid alkalinization factor-like [Arachis stenosperma]